VIAHARQIARFIDVGGRIARASQRSSRMGPRSPRPGFASKLLPAKFPRKGVLPLIDFPLALSCFDHAAFSVIAYLDPGMGSYALQILLATLFGGLFTLRRSWTGLKVWYASTIFGRPGRISSEIARPGVHGNSTAEIR
jgi:hypothetical protein